MGSKRAKFAGKLSAVLVAAGSAVGLGNIWRFPSVAGDNGGGAFLLLYILCVIVLGIPLMLAEFSVGRHTQKAAVGAYRSLGKRWAFIGYNGVLTAFLILGFYYVVSGWTLQYLFESATGAISNYSTPEEYAALFKEFYNNPWQPLLCAALFAFMTHGVIAMGVQKGIERISNILMPLLFIMLLVLAIHSILMPGSWEGVEFFIRPDFSKVTVRTVLMALGQAFFSLSIGLGCMVTYASYFNQETNLNHTAINVSALGSLVAVLAGMIIFPAAFSTGIFTAGAPIEAGPDLIFITLPAIFNTMPFGALWATIFFLLLVVAALTSTISLHEVLTAHMHEEWNISRSKANYITTGTMLLLSAAASLSTSVFSNYTIFGLTLFDLLDFVTANIMLPLGGLATCIFVGWILDRAIIKSELTNNYTTNGRFVPIVVFTLRWICPVILTVILLDSLGIF